MSDLVVKIGLRAKGQPEMIKEKVDVETEALDLLAPRGHGGSEAG